MIFRVNHTKNYTVMSNAHLQDRDLSMKAKGLLSLMLSLPENWDYSISGLCAICLESEKAVRSALTELQEAGYLIVTKHFPNETASGRIEYEYNVYETRQDDQTQGVQKQGVQKQHLQNGGLVPIYEQSTNNKVLKTNNEQGSKRFTPPTLEEVRAYCKERNNNVNAERFVDYYSSNGWKVGGKSKMVDWKAAVRNWERMDKKSEKHFNAERTYDDDFFKRLEGRDK